MFSFSSLVYNVRTNCIQDITYINARTLCMILKKDEVFLVRIKTVGSKKSRIKHYQHFFVFII
jgi:hypothetical protein